ncbi:MAG: ATP-binding cassette domain-containing protein [Candidatus Caldatribacteriota bacterium]
MKDKKEPLVRMVDICKSFGTVQALKGVNLVLYYNEVVGLVGDNGAGKSTLMKILTGAHLPTSGKIYIDGEEVHFTHPHQSREKGIEMVYQDMALAGNIDIPGNIFLGRELKKNLFGTPLQILDREKMEDASRKVLDQLKIRVDSLRTRVNNLSGGQQKAVAIGRSIFRKARIIIMDEPTAALSPTAVSKLLDLIMRIKKTGGVSIIFISHRLQDIFLVGDRVMVLREGKMVGDKKIKETTPEEVANLMVGADLIRNQSQVNLNLE